MFEPESRYAEVDEATREQPGGREVAYKRRRFIPNRQEGPGLAEAKLEASDRLDHVAAETLGDPRQYWRICDANGVMNPREIDEERGVQLTIPVAGAGE